MTTHSLGIFGVDKGKICIFKKVSSCITVIKTLNSTTLMFHLSYFCCYVFYAENPLTLHVFRAAQGVTKRVLVGPMQLCVLLASLWLPHVLLCKDNSLLEFLFLFLAKRPLNLYHVEMTHTMNSSVMHPTPLCIFTFCKVSVYIDRKTDQYATRYTELSIYAGICLSLHIYTKFTFIHILE